MQKTENQFTFAQIKHVIWDYNGTMLDDAWLCVETINEMLNERSVAPVTLESYMREFDFPVKNYYARVGFDFNIENFNQVGEEFITRYNRRHHELRLHSNIIELIEYLHNNGISQSVLSARKESELRSELQKLKLTDYFTHISGLSDNLAHGKLQNGIELRKLLPFEDSQIALIGDTTHDYETAKAMQVQFIALSHGHHTFEKLHAFTDIIFREPNSLKQFIEVT